MPQAVNSGKLLLLCGLRWFNVAGKPDHSSSLPILEETPLCGRLFARGLGLPPNLNQLLQETVGDVLAVYRGSWKQLLQGIWR